MTSDDGCINDVQALYMDPEFRAMSVWLPVGLRAKAGVIARRLRVSVAHLIREGLAEKIQAIEDAEEKQKAARAAKKLEPIARRQLNRIGESTTAPHLPILPTLPSVNSAHADSNDAGSNDEDDEVKRLIKQHVPRIVEAANDPREKRLRIREGIEAVKKQYPFSSPVDIELDIEFNRQIDRTLAAPAPVSTPAGTVDVTPPRMPSVSAASALATTIARQIPETHSRIQSLRFDDGLTGRTIDPTQMKSHGAVIDDDVPDEQT